jgi:uncharacterized protein
MNCPICNNVRMREVDKDGVAIDVCPDCKGVWLDRGELEKLMSEVRTERRGYDEWIHERERSSTYKDSYPRDHGHYSNSSHYRPKRKKSVFERLEDLFD